MLFIALLALLTILEVAAFVAVAAATSWTTAILIALATSALGGFVVRWNNRAARAFYNERAVKNYLLRNLAGFLLLTPGFVTDVLGVVVLIPPMRNATRFVLERLGLFPKPKPQGNAGVFSFARAFVFNSGFGDQNGSDAPFDENADESCNDECVDIIDANSFPPQTSVPSDDDEPIDVEFTVVK